MSLRSSAARALGLIALAGCVDGPVREGPPPPPAALEVRSFVGDPLLAPAGEEPRVRVDDQTALVRTTDHVVVRWGLEPGDWELAVGSHRLPLRLVEGQTARWTAWPEPHLVTVMVEPPVGGPPAALGVRGPGCEAVLRWTPMPEDRSRASGPPWRPARLVVPNGWWGVTPLAADGAELGPEEKLLVREGESGVVRLR